MNTLNHQLPPILLLSMEFHEGNQIPAFIGSPARFLSVVSTSCALKSSLDTLLDKCFYHRCETTQPLLLFDTLKQKLPNYYSVRAAKGLNELSFSSTSPNIISIRLKEHTFFTNSYVGRHIKFKKIVPFKGSNELITYFEAKVDISHHLHELALRKLAEAEFSACNVILLCDTDISKELPEKFFDLHKNKSFYAHSLLPLPNIPTVNNSISDMDSDESDDLYEFLSLVHLNAVPDQTNSHVRATNMWELPQPNFLANLAGVPLHSFSISNVNPILIHRIASMSEVLSIQMVTEESTHLLLRNNRIYTWNYVQ